MSWRSAGGMIANLSGLDPIAAGKQARAEGFGWVAVKLADGETASPSPLSWIASFRAASGLPVGGWTVLRDQPVAEAQLAASLLAQDHLDFYIADAEQEYGYTNGSDHSLGRLHRSREFVAAFRATDPTIPAGLSSFCKPDAHDLDWGAWAANGFAFLPQAYVSQLTTDGAPGVCATSAEQWFPRSSIHPTLGIFPGTYPVPTAAEYAAMLLQAGTTGFSLYPFEYADAAELDSYGAQIHSTSIAQPSVP